MIVRLFAQCGVVAIVFGATCSWAAQEAPQIAPSKTTQVVLLGTGTPVPDPRRSGPAVAVVVRGRAYLVDFGPGVVRRASEAYERGVRGLSPGRVEVAFVTHLHSDHTAGFADLILTPAVVGRTGALRVFGPPGIKSMTTHILAAYREDIKLRLEGYELGNANAYVVKAEEIKPGVVFEENGVKVRAIAVKHGQWKHAYGYRFDTPDRSIVISGDTTVSEELIEAAKGCDILVHEVYSAKALQMFPASGQRYHSSYHTSAVELGILAAQVKPRLLVLYHQLTWGSPSDQIMKEIRENYDGPVAYGSDLDVF